jgi:hypothetical protein
MSKSKLVRNRVIINQSSLELLDEINEQAAKLDCAVVIGVLTKGEPLLGGKTSVSTPFYMILEDSMFKDSLTALADTHIGFSKEDVLTQLIGIAKTKGE